MAIFQIFFVTKTSLATNHWTIKRNVFCKIFSNSNVRYKTGPHTYCTMPSIMVKRQIHTAHSDHLLRVRVPRATERLTPLSGVRLDDLGSDAKSDSALFFMQNKILCFEPQCKLRVYEVWGWISICLSQRRFSFLLWVTVQNQIPCFRFTAYSDSAYETTAQKNTAEAFCVMNAKLDSVLFLKTKYNSVLWSMVKNMILYSWPGWRNKVRDIFPRVESDFRRGSQCRIRVWGSKSRIRFHAMRQRDRTE